MPRSTKRSTPALSTSASPSGLPSPFTPCPSSLGPFLSTLDRRHVYIVHIDKHDWTFKRQIFAVPVSLNITFLALLIWRAYAIIPTYWLILMSALGHYNSEFLDASSRRRSEIIWLVGKRALNFLLDFVLIRIVWPWPLMFFSGSPANPVLWRWKIGFRDEEVIVRVSRKWGAEELLEGERQGEQNPILREKILPAVDRMFMQKTGYVMMGKNWDLDFAAMIRAHKLADSGEPPLSSFRKQVLAWVGDQENGQWAAWELWRMDEDDGENRKKIVAIKDRLTAMGKESLFFRWIEIVQYESSQPGGFTKERQRETLRKVQDEFAKQGVDFEALATQVGGLEAMSGLAGR